MQVQNAFLTFFLIAAGWQLSWQISLPSDPTYQAGVVEFIPSQADTPKARTRDNLNRMKELIEREDTRNLDILVFPEFVLNNEEWRTYVPDPALGIAPCDVPDSDFFLTTLSCAARSRNLYLVINVVEKEYCFGTGRRCHESGLNTFNTNVVFDRQGRVISRYRKTHLYRYEWLKMQVLERPEVATFSTDFGVTFGHFICFDMLFYEPAQILIKERNITDIIYPTYWFSELPFLTAVQLQESWAYANNINLLAADASLPSGQNTGSGIYAGKLGRLAAEIFEDPTTILLTASVPKRTSGPNYVLPPAVVPAFTPQLQTKRFSKMDLLRDYNVDIFTTKLLEANFLSVDESLCHGAFCCKFQIRRTLITESAAHSAYRYRLAAYTGSNTTFQRMDPADLSVCAVIACTNDQLYSCGHIFPDGVTVGNKYYFNTLSVSGSFRNAARRLIMPSSVDALMMPLPVSMFDMQEVQRANGTHVTITMTSPKADLLTFGIYANYYSLLTSKHNLDPPKSMLRSAATANRNSLLSVLLGTLAILVRNFKQP